MSVCYSGALDHKDEALAPIRALRDPVVDLLQQQPYVQLQSYLDDTEPKGRHYYWKTEYLSDLDDGLLALVPELAAACPIPEAQIGFLHIGGSLGEHEEHDGAVGNRDARFAVGLNGAWEPAEPQADAYRRWVRDAWQQLRPFSTGRAYINFQTADEDDDRVQASYGANFDRLAEVKAIYDPSNVFRSNRNISPSAPFVPDA